MATDVLNLEGWWEETLWHDRGVPALINASFEERDRNAAFTALIVVAAKYPEVGRILGMETRKLEGE